jgi:hypothetical protein
MKWSDQSPAAATRRNQKPPMIYRRIAEANRVGSQQLGDDMAVSCFSWRALPRAFSSTAADLR